MTDATQIAQNRIQNLLGLLHDKGLDLEELAELKRLKLEQAVQLCQFQNDANQVIINRLIDLEYEARVVG